MILKEHPYLKDGNKYINIMLYGEDDLFEGKVKDFLNNPEFKKYLYYNVEEERIVTNFRKKDGLFVDLDVLDIEPPKQDIILKVDARVASIINHFKEFVDVEEDYQDKLDSIISKIEDYVFYNYIWQ